MTDKDKNIKDKLKDVFNLKNVSAILSIISALYILLNIIVNIQYSTNCEEFYKIPRIYFSTEILSKLFLISALAILLFLPIILCFTSKLLLQSKVGFVIFTSCVAISYAIVNFSYWLILVDIYKNSIFNSCSFILFLIIFSLFLYAYIIIYIRMKINIKQEKNKMKEIDNNYINLNDGDKNKKSLNNEQCVLICSVSTNNENDYQTKKTIYETEVICKKEKQNKKWYDILFGFSLYIFFAIVIFEIFFPLVNPIENKRKYEFVSIKGNEYVVLSHVDDKVLICDFDEYDDTCVFYTSNYRLKNESDNMTYSYRYIAYEPIINTEKAKADIVESSIKSAIDR